MSDAANAKFAQMGGRLRDIILKRLDEGRLELPVMPKAAIKAQNLLGEDSVDLQRVAHILSDDPALVANVLRVANSSMYRRAVQIDNIEKAVTHLGARNLKNVLLTASARQAFVSSNRRINQALEALWDHSVAVGFLGRNLAGLLGHPDPESVYLAGLLHDIGKVVVALYLLEFERGLGAREAKGWIDDGSWLELIGGIHQPVGEAIAKVWDLPETVSRTIASCGDYDPSDRQSASNVVLFANSLAKREGVYVGSIDHDAVGSLLLIGRSLLGVDDDVVEGLTREMGQIAA